LVGGGRGGERKLRIVASFFIYSAEGQREKGKGGKASEERRGSAVSVPLIGQASAKKKKKRKGLGEPRHPYSSLLAHQRKKKGSRQLPFSKK